MSKRFFFSPRVSGIGFILVVTMLCLSHWQWNRHLEKKALIHSLEQRLEMPVIRGKEQLQAIMQNPEAFYHRKVLIDGAYDFSREVVIRNRRRENTPGVIVLTPVAIPGSEVRILINRGFLPLQLAKKNKRVQFHTDTNAHFIGLIKESNRRTALAPEDPETSGNSWHDEFIRVDIEHLRTQYPYPLAPFYVERMSSLDTQSIKEAIVKSDSDKEELLLLPMRAINESQKTESTHPEEYPVPFFTTVLPAGRHLGYVFEWAAMALMTVLICLILQLRPPRNKQQRDTVPTEKKKPASTKV